MAIEEKEAVTSKATPSAVPKESGGGFKEFIRDVYLLKKGVLPSEYKADRERAQARAKELHTQKIAKFNGEQIKGSNEEYASAKNSLLALEKVYDLDIANAQGNTGHIANLTEDYNSNIETINKRKEARVKVLAGNLLASGEYDFEESPLDNYGTYVNESKGKGEKPKDKNQWLNSKALQKMEEDGVLKFPDFETKGIKEIIGDDGKITFQKNTYDSKGEITDTDDLGSVDNMIMTIAGGSKAEVDALVSVKGKSAGKKQEIKDNFEISNMDELKLSPKEKSEFMKATVNISKKGKTFEEELTEVEEALRKRGFKEETITKIINQKVNKATERSGTSENERLIIAVADLKQKKELNGGLDSKDAYLLEQYEKLVLKKNQPNMNSNAINDKFVQEKKKNFLEYLVSNKKGQFFGQDQENINLSTIDTSKLTSKEKTLYGTYVNHKQKAERPVGSNEAVKSAMKAVSSLAQVNEAVMATANLMSNGNNINFLDKTYRDYLGNYFDLGDLQMQKALQQTSTASAFNAFRNSMFGATVSKGEGQMFNDGVATLKQSNSKILIGFTGMLGTMEAKLQAQRNILGEEAFNKNFGETIKRIKNTRKMINKALHLKQNPDGSTSKQLVWDNAYIPKSVTEKKTKKQRSWKDINISK